MEDKVHLKTHAWKHKLLSPTGRAIIVRSVLSTIFTYSMVIFSYSKQFSTKLNSLLSNFFMGWR